MPEPLNQPQQRVLGCLIEKQLSTPEYYPLSLNALVAACNQKNNRNPVVHYSEEKVADALAALTRRDLAREIHDSGSRVARYGHRVNASLGLDTRQAAVICELLLRGPQTPGELRGRASRMAKFETIEDTDAVLNALAERETGDPLVVQLPRQPGTKERRWAHLLGGEPVLEAESPATSSATDAEMPSIAGQTGADRLNQLEQEVASLREELAALRAAFEAFQRQFQ